MSAADVLLDTAIDWQTGVVTFSERSPDGMVLIGSPQIRVPMALILRLAATAVELSLPPEIRALNFVPKQAPLVNRDRAIAFDAKVGAN